MRTAIFVSCCALVAVLALSSFATAQSISDLGWGTCPRCQDNADRARVWEEQGIEDRPFDPRDLSGVWGYDGIMEFVGEEPPLTEYAQQWLADRGGLPASSRNTPELRRCDPLGWPRLATYNYGVEFIMLPDRVIQFFEWGHFWRTIWTDGRQLPENGEHPELRHLGWNVGRWDGDMFVVESNGYDGRNWISDEMRVIERYRRVSYGRMEVDLTIMDPRAYTAPYERRGGQLELSSGTELWEYICVPSDEASFDSLIHVPVSSGASPE